MPNFEGFNKKEGSSDMPEENFDFKKRFLLEELGGRAKGNPDALAYQSAALKDDKEVALKAVEGHSRNFEHVSARLKDDKEVALAAVGRVRGSGANLRFASEQLKNDKDVVRAAVLEGGDGFRHASQEIKKDKEFISELFSAGAEADLIIEIDQELLNDRLFLLHTVAINPFVYRFIPKEMRTDKEIAETAFNRNPIVVPEDIKKQLNLEQ